MNFLEGEYFHFIKILKLPLENFVVNNISKISKV